MPYTFYWLPLPTQLDFTGSESRNKVEHCVPVRSASVVLQTIVLKIEN